MTILIYCLLVALLLPFIAKAPVAFAMNKDDGYDNKHPRAQQAQLVGFGARALAAHQNAFESLVVFAPAILLAIATNHTGHTIQYLAITHILARVAYQIFYLLNWDKLRSTVWAIGLIACFAIVWQCLP
ncbi:MAG: MAPEG family protein [Kangiellaceae bacterium]|jgi:uncharacterized MAPEG superfamily protein